MCKKFLSLVLVLALSGIAVASNMNFVGDGDGSSWGDSLNWNTATDSTGTYRVPLISDNARPVGNMVTVNTASEVCTKLQMRGVAGSGATIQNGMALETSGSVEMDAYTAGTLCTITIDAGGTMNAATQSTGSSAYTAFKLGRDTNFGDDTVNVNGTLNVISADAGSPSELQIGFWNVGAWGGGGGGGTWTLNVGSAGVVNANILNIDMVPGDGTAIVDITTGGAIIVDGDVRDHLGGAVYGGVFKGDGVAGAVTMDYNVTNAGKTTIQVPEPATIALLSLGGLLLRKRR